MLFRTRDIISAVAFLLAAGAVLLCRVAPANASSVLRWPIALTFVAAPLVLSCCLPVPLLPVWLFAMFAGMNFLMHGVDGPGGFVFVLFLSLMWNVSLLISLVRGVIYIVDHAGRGGYRG